MKQKIAIMTQPLGRNYGGILQNFALQKVLKDHGYDPTTINRVNNHSYSSFRIFFYYFKVENILFKKNFNFIRKHINRTERIDSDQKFLHHFTLNKYDALIVGSDQTWRPKYSPNIYQYFLDFLQKDTTTKKIAYASSFGTAEWEFSGEQTEKVKKLVQNFDAVSVREDDGVSLCKNYLHIEADHVLDPTLLLKKEDYQTLYKDIQIENRKGVFVYVLDKKEENDKIIQKVQKNLDLPIFRNQSKSSIYKSKRSLKDQIYPSVESWVKSFEDADFIVTDSFHGTVFSILFQKPFLTIINKSRGASRFYSLLKPLGLEGRIINNLEEVTEQKINKSIDYTNTNQIIEDLRTYSLLFLKKALA